MTQTVQIIGPGRAGTAFASVLADAGWEVRPPLGREWAADVAGCAAGADLVLVTTPDSAVAAVAAAVQPDDGTVVAHASGSLGLDALGSHEHRLCAHPLVAIPAGPLGAQRLAASPWVAVAASSDRAERVGDEIVAALRGTAIRVVDDQRSAYHAAAVLASNHLVALLGQVERVAAGAGVPLDAYLALVRATVDNVAEMGPAAALTGPVARGDWATLTAHLRAIDASERPAYLALAAQARRLVDPTFDPAARLPVDGGGAAEVS